MNANQVAKAANNEEGRRQSIRTNRLKFYEQQALLDRNFQVKVLEYFDGLTLAVQKLNQALEEEARDHQIRMAFDKALIKHFLGEEEASKLQQTTDEIEPTVEIL